MLLRTGNRALGNYHVRRTVISDLSLLPLPVSGTPYDTKTSLCDAYA